MIHNKRRDKYSEILIILFKIKKTNKHDVKVTKLAAKRDVQLTEVDIAILIFVWKAELPGRLRAITSLYQTLLDFMLKCKCFSPVIQSKNSIRDT